VNDAAPAVDATNLNKIEQGIYDAHVTADGAIQKPAGPSVGDALVWNGSSWVAGDGGAMALIGVHEPNATLSGELFVNVAANTFRGLRVLLKVKRNALAHTVFDMRFNADDTTANYGSADFYATTTYSADQLPNGIYVGYIPGTDSASGAWGVYESLIFYPNDAHVKQVRSQGTWRDSTGSYFTHESVGLWLGTAAITKVRFPQPTGGWVAGSRLAVYGIV
jgi:hypothetical protein